MAEAARGEIATGCARSWRVGQTPASNLGERVMADRPVVLLGVTGGIAAYKAAELLRGLQKAGMDVRVIMTQAATQFVGPMTFETLSGHPVRLDEIS